MLRHDDFTDLPHASKVLFESDVVQIGATRCPGWHPDFESPGPIQRHVFYLGGSPVRVMHDGLETFLADSTTVSFHHRGEEPERRRANGSGDFSNWFAVAPDYLITTLQAWDPTIVERPDRPFPVSHGPCPAASFLLQRLLVERLMGSEDLDPLMMEEGALRLLVEVTRAADLARGGTSGSRSEKTADRHTALVDAVKELLTRRFRERIGLSQLAATVGSSPYHLARVFRAQTGWSLHGYRSQVRVRAALGAVLEGETDLTHLALDLGFSSHSHLTTSFRQAFGVAPSAVRSGSPRMMNALKDLLGDAGGGARF